MFRIFRRRTFRWKCKRCGWKLVTQNRETFEISKDSHVHNDEYKGVVIRAGKENW